MWRAWMIVGLCVVGLSGCLAADEARSREEFQSLVDDAAACGEAERCALLEPGCPFDCAVAVKQARTGEVQRAAADLRRQLVTATGSCEPIVAACPPAETWRAVCLQGRCTLDTWPAALGRVRAFADANRTCAVDLDCRAVETQCAEHDVCWLPASAAAATEVGARLNSEVHAVGFCPARERCEGIAQPYCDEAGRCQVRVLSF